MTADDVARDSGYRRATTRFWKWAKSVDLEALADKPLAFRVEDVRRVAARVSL